MIDKLSTLRFPLIGMIVLVLLASLWAGLLRLGLSFPVLLPGAVVGHGPLMVSGVLGTLICLERAVALSAALNRKAHWSYAVPVVNGIGGVLLALNPPGPAARILLMLGSLGLVAVFAVIIRRHAASYTVVMGLGAVAWLVGNTLWLAGWPVFAVVHWWIAFLVLTIVGERLELARITRLSPGGRRLFLAAVGVYLVGVAVTAVDLNAGVRLAGVGAILLALWLLRYDITRHTIRRAGLPRFIAVCLLLGYVWLGIGGLVGLLSGDVRAGFQYDALLHALLLGFVFSMIFGHAPIIFPALMKQSIRFHPLSYVYLALLHLSLLVRLAGDFSLSLAVRQWGGLLNVTAVLLFMVVTGYSVVRGRQEKLAAAV